MKDILRSLVIVLALAAAVGGATSAFFTDTEISAGNTFTAGTVDLTVGSTATLNGVPAAAGTWSATDLGAQRLWSLTDVVPGDYGTNTVALRVGDQDAWARIRLVRDATTDRDVSCTEPESADEPGCAVGNDGELDDVTRLWLWVDTDADGIWDGGEETIQAPATLAALGAAQTYDLAARTTFGDGDHAMAAGTTYAVGMGWCVGAIGAAGPVDPAQCDGSATDNAAQTDTYGITVGFDVTQKRNNPARTF